HGQGVRVRTRRDLERIDDGTLNHVGGNAARGSVSSLPDPIAGAVERALHGLPADLRRADDMQRVRAEPRVFGSGENEQAAPHSLWNPARAGRDALRQVGDAERARAIPPGARDLDLEGSGVAAPDDAGARLGGEGEAGWRRFLHDEAIDVVRPCKTLDLLHTQREI